MAPSPQSNPPSVLLTGASGYLGGTVLAQLASSSDSDLLLPRSRFDKIYALVRSDEQVAAIQQRYGHLGVEPIRFDCKDEAETTAVLLQRRITVVFYLIDAFGVQGQTNLIKALGAVKKELTHVRVHFLHTTGAKIFSSHAGAPTDRPLLDDDPHLYDIQKAQKAPLAVMQTPVNTNNTVIELCEDVGVNAYIFAPCIVYGKGEGFGNPISIQTKAIVQAAKALRRVYSVDGGEPTWPVCHVIDTATLYLRLLNAILSSSTTTTSSSSSSSTLPPPSGKQGYYLASSGAVKWIDLYRAMAKTLHAEGIIDTAEVAAANDKILGDMAAALKCPPELVPVQLGGQCTFEARRAGHELGWTPQYPPQHAIESADEETRLILANL